MTVAAQSLGIAIGCIIGLVPLLFLDQKEKALRASFDDVDLSGDGFLDKYEIAMALHRFGVMLSEKNVEDLIRHCDKNHDQKIDFNEYCDLLAQWECLSDLERKPFLHEK